MWTEIWPHRWGWKAFEAPGVEPVFPKKDLRPSAAKKIKDYVWVGEGTGSHLPGYWVEVLQ